MGVSALVQGNDVPIDIKRAWFAVFCGHHCVTLMCLSIGTPKTINFPFVPNGKFIIFRCPKIWSNTA